MSNELINIAEYENKLNEWYDKFFVLGMLTKHIGL